MSQIETIIQVLNVQNTFTTASNNLQTLLKFITDNDSSLRYLQVSYRIAKIGASYTLILTKHLKEVT